MKRYFTQFFLILFTVFFLLSTALAAPLEGSAGTGGTSGSGSPTTGPLSTGSACTYANTYCPSGNTTCLDISCSSGYCVDGYCCNSRCTGGCNSCSVSGSVGTCTDVNTACAGTSSSCYCSSGGCAACASGYTCSSYQCVTSAPTGGGGAAAAPTPTVVESTKTIPSASPTAPAIVTIEADKAKDLKVDEVKVEVKEAVSNVQVTVKESSLPSGATVAISSDVGSSYKYLDVTTNVPSEKLEKVKIKFKVEKSWITTSNIASATIALNRYADNKWNKLPTEKVSEDATYVYYEAETTALSTFVITGEKKVAAQEACPFECCAGEVKHTDKGCASGYECKNNKCVSKCPACPSPTSWSDCINDKQSRTNYKCSAETNYQCQTYAEEQTCKVVAPVSKVPKTWIFIVLAVILSLVFYQFRKRKTTSRYKFRFKPKK